MTSGIKAYSAADRLRECADLRMKIIETFTSAGAGHLGSSLSIVDLLVAVFRDHFRWRDGEEPSWAGDRFVLSKGHAALALYCLLEHVGKLSPQLLATFGENGSSLEPHPNELLVPEVHVSTGSLGQGLSVAVGLALGSRLRGSNDRVFVVVGDGEANEGQIWEAARAAVTLGLGNLVVLLDDNGMQQDGPSESIMPVRDLSACWSAMGWRMAAVDGHNCDEVSCALAGLLETGETTPKLIHAQTIKGRGVEFLEGVTESHYPAPFSADEFSMIVYSLESEVRRAK